MFAFFSKRILEFRKLLMSTVVEPVDTHISSGAGKQLRRQHRRQLLQTAAQQVQLRVVKSVLPSSVNLPSIWGILNNWEFLRIIRFNIIVVVVGPLLLLSRLVSYGHCLYIKLFFLPGQIKLNWWNINAKRERPGEIFAFSF